MRDSLGLYILRGHTPVPCKDLHAWAEWFESADRLVAREALSADVEVSTVFIALDHSFGRGPPLVFETMIFGGPLDGYTDRYSTWNQAEAGHRRAVAMMRERMPTTQQRST